MSLTLCLLLAGSPFVPPAVGVQESPQASPAAESSPFGEAFASALTRYLDERTEQELFSGTVLVAQDGVPVFTAARGLASRRFDVPNRLDTKFNLGSMNKMFTAVAALQLVERRELFLDDPIGAYLDESWLDLAVLERVQVQHLLCHTSGLGSYFSPEFMDSSRLLFRELADYQPFVRGETLAFAPGSHWSYSNTGFLVAGAVIEAASGVNYFDYIRENIYQPAGMSHSDCYDVDRPVPNLAIGYMRADDGGWRDNTFDHVVRGSPAGGGYSTVEDLLRFAVALQSHRLLSPELTEVLWTAKPELGSPGYGFGMGVRASPLGRQVGHNGGFPGLNSELRIYRDRGLVVAVMSNVSHGASPVVEHIEELLVQASR